MSASMLATPSEQMLACCRRNAARSILRTVSTACCQMLHGRTRLFPHVAPFSVVNALPLNRTDRVRGPVVWRR